MPSSEQDRSTARNAAKDGKDPILAEGHDRALDLLRKCACADGFLASPSRQTNYRRVWGRDGAILSLAALLTDDSELLLRCRSCAAGQGRGGAALPECHSSRQCHGDGRRAMGLSRVHPRHRVHPGRKPPPRMERRRRNHRPPCDAGQGNLHGQSRGLTFSASVRSRLDVDCESCLLSRAWEIPAGGS
jgi:hypothetical protein